MFVQLKPRQLFNGISSLFLRSTTLVCSFSCFRRLCLLAHLWLKWRQLHNGISSLFSTYYYLFLFSFPLVMFAGASFWATASFIVYGSMVLQLLPTCWSGDFQGRTWSAFHTAILQDHHFLIVYFDLKTMKCLNWVTVVTPMELCCRNLCISVYWCVVVCSLLCVCILTSKSLLLV